MSDEKEGKVKLISELEAKFTIEKCKPGKYFVFCREELGVEELKGVIDAFREFVSKNEGYEFFIINGNLDVQFQEEYIRKQIKKEHRCFANPP